MEHSFDIDIAKEVGINAAIIYKHIQFWCAKNKANDKHFHEGYYWTYNSSKAYTELFPYMTERQINYALTKLIESGYIIKDKFNKAAYDQTNWYADIHEQTPLATDFTNLSNQNDKIVKPIPNNKLQIVNNNVLSKDNTSPSAETFQFGILEKPQKKNLYQKCADLINDWTNIDSIKNLLFQYLDLCMEMKSIRGANQWKGMLNTLEKAQMKCHPHTYEEIIEMSINHGWKTFYPIKDLEGFKGKVSFDEFIRNKNDNSKSSNLPPTKSSEEF